MNRSRRPLATHRSSINRALVRIQFAPLDSLTIAELASHAAMSRFHFCRVFRKVVGCSPGEHLRRVRVERAKQMLAGGERIADIAISLGFADQSHFTRVFRARVGIPPGSFARASRSMAS